MKSDAIRSDHSRRQETPHLSHYEASCILYLSTLDFFDGDSDFLKSETVLVRSEFCHFCLTHGINAQLRSSSNEHEIDVLALRLARTRLRSIPSRV